MLSFGSPAALNASLQALCVFTAAVEPVSRSRRRSGPAAAPSPAPYHRRTFSLLQPQPLFPNLPHELHSPSRRRSQVNRHVRTHLRPLPTRPPQQNVLLLSFPLPVRLG